MNKGKHAINLFILGLILFAITIWWVGFPVQLALLVLLIAAIRLPKDMKKDIAVAEMTLLLLLFYVIEMFGEVRWIVFLQPDYRIVGKVVLFLFLAHTWLKIFARLLNPEKSEKLRKQVFGGILLCGIMYPFILNIDEALVLWVVFSCVIVQIFVITVFCQAVFTIRKQSTIQK